ncbi:MAG: serine hydrolase domain-containing protein [Rhodanobacteraceae bacterium]
MVAIKHLSISRHLAHSGHQHSTVGLVCTLLLAMSLLPISCLAGSAKHSPEVNAGPSPEKIDPDTLKRTVADYSRWIDELEASGRVSGLSTAIVSGNKVLLEKSIGLADVRTGEPVKPETVFRIASLSKAFSSALAALLVRDGLVDWNTRLADVLTYFKLRSNRATEHMTLRDILSHRTGLPHNTFDHKLEDDVPYQELVRDLDKVRLTCAVGECYSYQNVAFSMFGDLVYAVTGDFFNHQVEKRLFQPLHMKTATYGRLALEDSKSWARPHLREHGHFVTLVPKPNYYWVSPAAGVNASIRDLEKWLSAQMSEDPEVLPYDVLAELHEPVVNTPGQTRFSRWRRVRLRRAGYALGWRVLDYAGHTLVFHAGAVEGYRAMIGFLPEYRLGVVMLWNCNCKAPAGLMPMFLDSVLGLPAVNWARLKPRPQG